MMPKRIVLVTNVIEVSVRTEILFLSAETLLWNYCIESFILPSSTGYCGLWFSPSRVYCRNPLGCHLPDQSISPWKMGKRLKCSPIKHPLLLGTLHGKDIKAMNTRLFLRHWLRVSAFSWMLVQTQDYTHLFWLEQIPKLIHGLLNLPPAHTCIYQKTSRPMGLTEGSIQ